MENKTSLMGVVVRITQSERKFVTLLLKLEIGAYGLTYTGEMYRNYHAWKQLKIGDEVRGLQWKDEKKKIIDADSPVHLAQDSLR
jgi:hypothetical protein